MYEQRILVPARYTVTEINLVNEGCIQGIFSRGLLPIHGVSMMLLLVIRGVAGGVKLGG